MNGTALIFRPGSAAPEASDLAKPPGLSFLQQAVGGYIEIVPHFDQVEHAGQVHRCIAFCNEEGKLHRLPFNEAATAAWDDALPPDISLRTPARAYKDFLVGPVIVLFGDAEFMRALSDADEL